MSVVAILGMSFWWTQRNPDGIGVVPFDPSMDGVSLLPYLSFLVTLLIAASVCALYSKKIENAFDTSRIAIMVPSALVSALLVIKIIAFPSNIYIAIAENVVHALWAVSMIIGWPMFIVGLDRKLCFLIPSTAFLLSFLFSSLRIPIEYSQALQLILALFPLASGITLSACYRMGRCSNAFIPSATHDLANVPRIGVKLITLVLSTSLIANATRAFLMQNPSSAHDANAMLYCFAALISIGFIAVIVMTSSPEKILQIAWGIVIIVFFASGLLSSFGGQYSQSIPMESLFAAGTYCISLFFWLVLTQTSRRYGVSPVLLHCVFEVPLKAAIGFITAFFVPGILQMTNGDPIAVSPIAYSVFLLICAIGLLAIDTRAIFSVERSDHNESDAQRACKAIASEYGLSPREEQVLLLLSEGNSQKKISEILFVAQSTTQSHIKSIYRKTSIHSRQEAIDLVNGKASFYRCSQSKRES